MGYGCAALNIIREGHLERKMQFPWNHAMPLYNEQPILVNNAGIAQPRKLEEITETEWDEVLTVNLKSVFLVTQAVIGGMRKRGWRRIITISSVAAQTGGAVGPHYAASKAGMIGLTHSCALNYVRDGITVNAIAPALIETEMVTSNMNAKDTIAKFSW